MIFVAYTNWLRTPFLTKFKYDIYQTEKNNINLKNNSSLSNYGQFLFMNSLSRASKRQGAVAMLPITSSCSVVSGPAVSVELEPFINDKIFSPKPTRVRVSRASGPVIYFKKASRWSWCM